MRKRVFALLLGLSLLISLAADTASVLRLAKTTSTVAVSKSSGKKLEVNLLSSNVFFDVSEPLTDTESLNIRTSIMIIGIGAPADTSRSSTGGPPGCPC
ncbi:hypothetical protein D1159_15755 [Pseudoflavonifractor sp. 524-17]|uniref:hypothetical protein n=1 Tax=Pseudoflavonifractor sp. 524-17 TaxID=2304577 RepID=UPI00137AE5F6|nr:hypothetical protein [Pseudoflavonifractor sp. 524-17]NCE65994.1 hypothetical protein [Pseudoflavonifractor sp. 524-17]